MMYILWKKLGGLFLYEEKDTLISSNEQSHQQQHEQWLL